MKIYFKKYHALKNDFIIIEMGKRKLSGISRSKFTEKICDRRSGVGADGVLFLSKDKNGNVKIDLYNSDGGWAEKSGNGLRIVGLHEHLKDKRRKKFNFKIDRHFHSVTIERISGENYLVKTELGYPVFETKKIPVKSKYKYLINSPLKIHGIDFPVTCLSVGNPHTVIFVESFDFEWEELGEIIENYRVFPNQTNVEFVKVANRKKIIVNDWERGAGATGSSGTGAAAAVCASVINGLVDRKCQVVFETGSLYISWDQKTNMIELTGPVEYVAEGYFNLA